MTRVEVDISFDAMFESDERPGIVGPRGDGGWVVYIPGLSPCICDSFDEAAGLLRKYIKPIAAQTKEGEAVTKPPKFPRRIWLIKYDEPNDQDLYVWHRKPPLEPVGQHWKREYVIAPTPTPTPTPKPKPRKRKKVKP